ncbi:MAG TPA: plastocyanin/azurin family copper-binding protein [Solirubrobacteraceae bacterium]|nr:plastocyanin/azurin family copper-binding protein [Solirubrobacteraceae bacterium]
MATSLTKVVFAGPSPAVNKVAAKLVPKSFVKAFNPDINAFFSKKTTINVGDTVSFQIAGFHDIDLPGKAGAPLPFIVPGKTLVSGINDAAGNPFWFNGKVPTVGVNPALLAPSKGKTYNGSQRLVSGLPAGKPKPFNVKFTKAGTYKFFCDIHPGMIGTVVVKPGGQTIPSAKQDAKAQAAQATVDIKGALKAAKAKLPANTVSLGESAPGGVELFSMFPASLTVNANTVVTFQMSKDSFETHTATFGTTPVLKKLAKGFEGVSFPAQGVFPSDPTQPISESLTAHGDGFANTGALDTSPKSTTIPSSGKIDFTQAGTYHFICLIHPFMHGTIIVK